MVKLPQTTETIQNTAYLDQQYKTIEHLRKIEGESCIQGVNPPTRPSSNQKICQICKKTVERGFLEYHHFWIHNQHDNWRTLMDTLGLLMRHLQRSIWFKTIAIIPPSRITRENPIYPGDTDVLKWLRNIQGIAIQHQTSELIPIGHVNQYTGNNHDFENYMDF